PKVVEVVTTGVVVVVVVTFVID
ncbi:hypothetical protein CP8484711_0345, partial [Chlamydia psittaci 84-8471/1]